MTILKKYKYLLYFLLYILIISIIETIINLMIPLSTNTNQILSLILILSYIFISSIKKGINTEEKAYINGIKQGLLYTVILYITGLPLLIYKLSIKRLLYFLIIIIITILGNIIGINKKTLK